MFNHVGHIKSFLKNGIEHDLVISRPSFTDGIKFAVVGFFEWIKLGCHSLGNIDFSENLAEEDKLNIFVQSKGDILVAWFYPFDFANKFFN